MTPNERRLLLNIGRVLNRHIGGDVALARAVADCEIEMRAEAPTERQRTRQHPRDLEQRAGEDV